MGDLNQTNEGDKLISSSCQLHFVQVNWPEFTKWDLIPILLSYMTNQYLSPTSSHYTVNPV